MKLIISLIILSFYFSNYFCVNAQSSNDNFVNFEVYNDENCKNIQGVNYGVGYSSVINTCITLDYKNNFLFKIQNNNQVEWSFYLNEGNVNNCNGDPIVKPSVHGIGECLSSNVINFNSNLVANKQPFYYKLTTSSTPFAPLNSFSTVYMDDDCNEDSILLIESFVNGTSVEVDAQGNTYNYYCSKNSSPYVEYCPSNQEKCERTSVLTDICHNANAFFNSSSDSSNSCASGTISGSSITGCKGGMDTGSTGISSSGNSGSASASSSGSGFGSGSAQNKALGKQHGSEATSSGALSGKSNDITSGLSSSGRTNDITTGSTHSATSTASSGGSISSGSSGSSGGSSGGGGGSGLVIHKNINKKNTYKDIPTQFIFAYQCTPSQH